MNNNEVKNKLESSFSPYRCFVQFDENEYGRFFRMQISNSDGLMVFSAPKINTSMINGDAIEDYITQVKIQIRESGFRIN